ncbi:hypothetical protein VUR80DRAFT_7689 [Thermomyces stellatus]
MSSKPVPRPGSGAASGAPCIAIDQAKFPSLPTQKALLLIDFQNDFVTKDGAVPVSSADDALVERAAKLAAGFRDMGIVIWVQSQFEKPRRFIEGQQIITSASQAPASGGKDEKLAPDPEAFLSAKNPTCVQRGSHGWQLATPLKKIVDPKRDVVLMKTHYSAFQETKLIQMLRSKLVTSLFICGSLINVGVHATTVDAAAHGYSITLVRDCCGWSDQARADAAIANLTNVSGCAVVRARTIVLAIGAEEDGAGTAVVREIASEKIEADDRTGTEDAEDEMNESGLDVLKELKKKYMRSTVMSSRTRTNEAGEEGSGKAGEKTAVDRTLGETRAPLRQRSEGRAKEQKPLDRAKELEEGMNKLSLSSNSKNGDSAPREDRLVDRSAERLKRVRELSQKFSQSSNTEKSASQSDVSATKPAGKTMEAIERSDKPRSANVETSASRRGDHSTANSADKMEGSQEGMDKLSLSSDKKSTLREDRTTETPTERTSELQESMNKLLLSESKDKDSAVSANRPVADCKREPGRGGAPACTASAGPTSAQESKSGKASRSDSQVHEKNGKVKSPPPEASHPIAPGDRVLEPGETKETSKQRMSAQTTTAPAAIAGPPPRDVPSPKGSEPLCEGDTTVIYDVLPPRLEAGAFEKLKDEVDWQRMSHLGGEVPRLVAVQGSIGPDGSHPVYRHPSDESPPLLPFSPTVDELRREVERHLGHELNHVLIQFYRDGKDYISEHSDKTLDIVPGSYIANLSLGAERTMVFRTKRPEKEPEWASPARAEDTSAGAQKGDGPATTDAAAPEGKKGGTPTARETQRARLPHNSLLRMGLKTNATWLHSIRQDKRLPAEKTAAELSFSGARISLTFRLIGTFLDEKEEFIWGQGAKGKHAGDRRRVVNGDESEGERMVRAFGVENRMGKGFDWGRWYGEGFDVLHMRR